MTRNEASREHAYLTVPNWERHQHRDLANKGNMPWFKMDAGIFDDPAIADLTAQQFRAYILLLTLAARTGNRLPASKTWLRAHFGTNWNRNLRELSKSGLLEGSIPSQKDLQTGTTHRAVGAPIPRLEEKRGEKTKDQPLSTSSTRYAAATRVDAGEEWDAGSAADELAARRRMRDSFVEVLEEADAMPP